LLDHEDDDGLAEESDHAEIEEEQAETSDHVDGGDDDDDGEEQVAGSGEEETQDNVDSDRAESEQEAEFESGEEQVEHIEQQDSDDQHEIPLDEEPAEIAEEATEEQDSDQDSNLAVTYAESEKSIDQDNQGEIFSIDFTICTLGMFKYHMMVFLSNFRLPPTMWRYCDVFCLPPTPYDIFNQLSPPHISKVEQKEL